MIMNVIITSASTSRIVATAFGDKTPISNCWRKKCSNSNLLLCLAGLLSMAAVICSFICSVATLWLDNAPVVGNRLLELTSQLPLALLAVVVDGHELLYFLHHDLLVGFSCCGSTGYGGSLICGR